MFGHVQLTFFLFFIITPKFTRSIQFDPRWAEQRPTNGNLRSLGSYRHKQQCSREDERCTHSTQCCQGLVCLQAGYSDGHCTKKSHLQSCSTSSDCPDDCVCEVMGLKVDGVTGFCVARINLDAEHYRKLRTGLRSGIGGMVDPERPYESMGDTHPRNRDQTGTMESIYEEVGGDRRKADELQGMIDRLEAVKDHGRYKIGGNRRSKSYLPPRSVSYLSTRNIQPFHQMNQPSPFHQMNQPSPFHQMNQPSSPLHPDVPEHETSSDIISDSMTSQERYELFCRWLKKIENDKGHLVRSTISRDQNKFFDESEEKNFKMNRETRLGHKCHVTEQCRSSDSLDRWQVCCARVSMMRQGVKLVCERITPITRCVD